MNELTDNEKAAIYWGWTPNSPCIGGIGQDGWCEHGNYGVCTQPAVAPDMALPNNYMRAVGNLDSPNMSGTIKLNVSLTMLEELDKDGFPIWYISINHTNHVGGPGLHNTMVKALAAYYDHQYGEKDGKQNRSTEY